MISPQKKTVREILKGSESHFVIPKYQRTFDWGVNELQELIDDLKETSSSDTKLFLGSFIFKELANDIIEIVDGQQRLTTITLIYIAIREHAKKINEKIYAGQIQQWIKVDDDDDSNRNKITVSDNILDIFNFISEAEWDGIFPDKIEKKPVKRQVNKVKPILKHILDNISNFNIKELKAFAKALSSSYVIVISVNSDEDVFAIFERTNARGLDLNIGDLLKNYIFSKGVDKFEDVWDQIIQNADGSLQRMLKYFWVSRRGAIQTSKLYKTLQKYVNKIGIDEFVKELDEFSRYYKVVQSLNPEMVREWLEEIGLENISSNEDYYIRINRVFQALKLFRVTQAYPVIYSLFMYYKRIPPKNPNMLFTALETIENYHFVNNVISGRIGNEVEAFYTDEAKDFYCTEEHFSKRTQQFITGLANKRAYEDEFVSNFIESITYSQKNIQLINYIFDRINNHGARGAQIVAIYSPEKDLNKRNFNIEHLLPQSWKDSDELSDDDKECFDQIGNLLVISRHTNSEFQDKPPKDKIQMITDDPKHFCNLQYLSDFISRYKEAFPSWGIEEIKKRSKDLAKDGFENIWGF